MKTIQKRVKFSKGEINPLLDERTDIALLDESASYIKNYIPTIYGGIKTRQGTKFIDAIYNINTQDITAEITSNIGGSITNNLNNYESNLIKNTTGELLHFKFNSAINYFALNNVKLRSGMQAVLRPTFTKKRKPSSTVHSYYYEVGGVIIDNAGFGYNDGTIQLTLIKNVSNNIIFPKITATITNSLISGYSIVEKGYGVFDNFIRIESPQLPSFALNIKFQGKNEGTGWEDIQEYQLNQNDLINIKSVNRSYTEFRLYTENTNIINTTIQIENSTYGQLLQYIGKSKILKFFYNDKEYIIVITTQSILIYKNDVLVGTLQNDKITDDIIDNIKYTQANNRLYITHTNIKPLELYIEDDAWYLREMNLLNIPYTNFGDDIEQQITNITLTPSAEEGSISISSNTNFFTQQSVGQIIDGNGGRLRITSFVSNVKVYGYTIIPFYTKDAFSNFKYITGYEPTWSETRGYPSCCLYYQQRLWFGGSKSKPTGLWGSRVGQNYDFNNIGNYENDAIDIEISSKDNAQITNLYGNRGLQIFTETAEFVANEGNLNPNDIFITQTSSVGNDIKTLICDIAGTTLFIDRKGLNINTFVYDDSIASYQSQALTLLNNQLINKPVAIDIDYNSSFEDGNFVFLVNQDGTAITNNILLEQKINSATRFIIDNFNILDVVVSNNKTYLIVEKDNYNYLVKLDNYKTDLTIERTIINNNIIDDLILFDNQYVRVYSENNDYGTYLVEGGIIQLETTINEKVYIGLDIDCQLISNDISVNGNTNNIKSRIAKAVITTTQDTDKIIFNNKSPQPHKEQNNNIFTVLSAGSYSVKNNFKIQSKFDFLELKSIVLIINYGK